MRTRILRSIAVATGLGLLGGLALDVAPAAADTGSDEMTFVGFINAERANAGLAPLAPEGSLFDSARVWSQAQVNAGTISHDDSFFTVNRPAGAAAVAENVAYNSNIAAMHERLMASPGHRANIMNPQFTSVGIGEVIAPDGRIFVTQRFAKFTPAATASAQPAAKASAQPKAKAKGPVRKARSTRSRNRRSR